MRLQLLQALRLPFLTMFLATGLLASTGCATKPPALVPGQLVIPVADSLREPCPRPTRPQAPTVGDLAAFSVNQEASISVCEARKDAAVAVIDAHNDMTQQLAKDLRPKHWWAFWR